MKILLFIFFLNFCAFAGLIDIGSSQLSDSDKEFLITLDEAFLSSLTGILIGFTILFFSIFLTIKIGSKK